MSVWYAFLNALGIRMFEMNFMKNALLAVLLLGPLFGLLSTMIVTGKMSFFSDALGHSGFTGIAIGVLCGAVQPIYFAVGLSVLFALLLSFVRSRTSQSADTIIGVFSSTAVALGIFIVTLGGCDDRAAAGCLLCRVLCTAEPGCLRKRQNFAGIPCGFRLFCHLYAGKKCDKL